VAVPLSGGDSKAVAKAAAEIEAERGSAVKLRADAPSPAYRMVLVLLAFLTLFVGIIALL
jgi:hypothetical protein